MHRSLSPVDGVTMSESLHVAKTIRDQIIAVDPMAAMSWGMSSCVAIPASRKHLGGLSFRVYGRKVTGRVAVYLDPSDTYIVAIHPLNSPDASEVRRDVYCDQLTDIIDRLVET